MPSAAAELQRAIVEKLRGDAELAALLGGPKVIDHAPANIAFPYVSLGRLSSFDWSTATERGSEHIVTLNVWSRGKGKREALEIMAHIETLLHDAKLELEGFALVNLRVEGDDVRFDEDAAGYQGAVRVRAIIEIA